MPEEKTPAEQLATKPVKLPVAAVAIMLMSALALNTLINGVNSVHEQYAAIISEQAAQLAAVSAAREKKAEPTNELKQGEPQESNRVIVKYKEEAKLPPGLTIAAERANLEKAQGLVRVLTIKGVNAEVYQVSEADTASEVVARILSSKRDLIEYAEVDMLVAPSLIPNDPLFSSQWHHNNVQSATAWDTAQGEGVTVATLDTGLDVNHPDLLISEVPTRNFFNNTNDVTDNYGHGTKVAGTAAANGNNSVGVSGIAPKAKNLGIRVSDDTGYGSWSAMANGIIYAADNGARVANLSYGNSCNSATINSAADYLRKKGGVLTVSAGNTGGDNSMTESVFVTCVSATDPSDSRTSWSSWGTSVDVSAPGAGIYTTTNGGGYGAPSGTSFSAPLVAGIYALIFSANPALTPNQADNIIFSTADDIGEPGWDMYYGHGRVNAAKAVAAAEATLGTRDTVAPSIPTNLRTVSLTSNSIAIAWNSATDDNTGVTGYDIYQGTTKITSVGGTAYTHTGLTPQTAYTYIVRAVDGAGNISGDSNVVSAITPDVAFGISSYSVPTKTTTTATVAATLTKPGTVVVKYGKTAGALTSTASSSASGTSHSVSLSGLTAKTTYYYQVVATDATGTVVTSNVSSFKTSTGGGRR